MQGSLSDLTMNYASLRRLSQLLCVLRKMKMQAADLPTQNSQHFLRNLAPNNVKKSTSLSANTSRRKYKSKNLVSKRTIHVKSTKELAIIVRKINK